MSAPDIPMLFYGIVTQYDMNDAHFEKYSKDDPGYARGGPLLHEAYLTNEARDEAKVHARAAMFTGYGWVRVVKIDIQGQP